MHIWYTSRGMFRKILIGMAVNAAALYGVIYFLADKITYTGGVVFFIIGAIVIGLLNSIVKPLLKLMTLPLQIVTLGFSLIFLNGIIFWLFKFVIDTLVIDGVALQVADFKTYFMAGFVFGVINWIEHLIIPSH